MKQAASTLWANVPVLAVAVYCLLSVAPRFASKTFPDYDLRWGWVAWAVAAGVTCLVAAVRPPCRRCRLTAAALASTYILARAIYTRWQYPMLSPWASFFLAVALSTCIAWSWGRPPIIRRRIATMPRPGR